MAIYASDTAAVPFELCGGHPALDFVNSFEDRFDPQGGKELADYGALLRFAEEAGLLTPPQARGVGKRISAVAAGKIVRAARELREALAVVLYAVAEERTPSNTEIELLDQRLSELERPRQLQWVAPESGSHPSLQRRWRGDQVRAVEFPLWLIAEAASQLVASDALGHVRTCEADTCRWLFLDTSKNHTRRWCTMKVCGNRAKARRFQERRAR